MLIDDERDAVFKEFASRVLWSTPSLMLNMRVNNVILLLFFSPKSLNAQVMPRNCEMTANEIFLISNLRFSQSKWAVIAGCASDLTTLIDLWTVSPWIILEDSNCSLPFSPASINHSYSTRPNQIKTYLPPFLVCRILPMGVGVILAAVSLKSILIFWLIPPSVSLSPSPAGTVSLNWPKLYITNDGSEWMSPSFVLL